MMLSLVVTERGGDQRRMTFDKEEITIGRIQGNDIILPKGNVSKRHSRIVAKDGKWVLLDLKSTNGTYVNGRRIASAQVVQEADKIFIGDFILQIELGDAVDLEPPSLRAAPPPPAVSGRKKTESVPMALPGVGEDARSASVPGVHGAPPPPPLEAISRSGERSRPSGSGPIVLPTERTQEPLGAPRRITGPDAAAAVMPLPPLDAISGLSK